MCKKENVPVIKKNLNERKEKKNPQETQLKTQLSTKIKNSASLQAAIFSFLSCSISNIHGFLSLPAWTLVQVGKVWSFQEI